jgi:hypothetical protein
LVGLGWLGLAWLGLAWLGLGWLGLAWLGLAWLGLAWLGLAWRFHNAENIEWSNFYNPNPAINRCLNAIND